MSTPVAVFLYWLFGTFLFATFAAGSEHGSSLIRFAVMMVVGVVAGIVHASLLVIRERRQRGASKRKT